MDPVGETSLRTVALMGLAVAAVSERETISYVLDALGARRGGWICPANLDVLRQWHASAQVRELVAGSSLILSLTAAATDVGASVFLLGGNPGTAETAVQELRRRSPGLRLAGTMCPPLGFEDDPEWLDRIERRLLAARPDIVYVALGFPKQERLIVALRTRLPATWFISCGISFSFVAGELRRAPAVMQRLGLEWCHRLAQEPRRLYRRYLLQGLPFLVTLLGSAIVVRVRGIAVGEVRRCG